jgi:hypothetical protein
MKIQILALVVFIFTSCTTIHFRSNNNVPVSFEGNPNHQKEISIIGQKHFYFWGVEPEEHEVYVDEEVMKAGYNGISKLIIYEHKDPQDILISFLTLGFYLPRGYTITGFTSDMSLPESTHQSTEE